MRSKSKYSFIYMCIMSLCDIEIYIIISPLASPGPGQGNNYFWLFIDRRLGGSFVCGNVFPMFGSLCFAHISSGEKIKIFSDKTNWLFVPKRSSKSLLFHFSSQFKKNPAFFFFIFYFKKTFLFNKRKWSTRQHVSYQWWYSQKHQKYLSTSTTTSGLQSSH